MERKGKIVEKHTGDNRPDYTVKRKKVRDILEDVVEFDGRLDSSMQSAIEDIFAVFEVDAKDVPVSELEDNKRYDRILSLLQLAAQLQRGNFRLSDNACSAGISNMIKATGVDMEFEKIDEFVKEVIWRQAAYSGDNVESDAPDETFGYLANLIDQNLPY